MPSGWPWSHTYLGSDPTEVPWLSCFLEVKPQFLPLYSGGVYLLHLPVVRLSENKGKGPRGHFQGSWESPRDNSHCF